MAHILISERADEAVAYLEKHSPVRSLGKNIWHAILDDAIRIREYLEK